NPAIETIFTKSNIPDDLNSAIFTANRLALVSSAKLKAERKEEDWCYRIDFIKDETKISPTEINPNSTATVFEAPSPGSRTDQLKLYLAVADGYRKMLKKGFGKEIVGFNNIAEITFIDNDATIVAQDLWWRMGEKNSVDEAAQLQPFPLTKTKVLLEIDESKYPKLKIQGRDEQ
ncbi:MAG: hypothetical protein AB1489_35935, partial [Acidobacteriota bacterium]